MTDRIEQLHDLAKRCLNASAEQPSPWHQIMAIRNVLAGTGLFLDNGLPDGVRYDDPVELNGVVLMQFTENIYGATRHIPAKLATTAKIAEVIKECRKDFAKGELRKEQFED